MKKFLLLFGLYFLVCMAAGAQSYQSVPYFTGFEGLNTGDQPTGWMARRDRAPPADRLVMQGGARSPWPFFAKAIFGIIHA